jgi:hypothetical protein
MKSMIPTEWHAFLLFGKRTAKVATVRSDGRVQQRVLHRRSTTEG